MLGVVIFIAVAAILAIIFAAAGVPLLLAVVPLIVGVGGFAALQVYKRRESGQQMARLREQAEPDHTDFTARDRETQA